MTAKQGRILVIPVDVNGKYRKIRIQRIKDGAWKTQKVVKTNRAGRVKVRIPVAAQEQRWRLVVVAKGRYRRLATKQLTVKPEATKPKPPTTSARPAPAKPSPTPSATKAPAPAPTVKPVPASVSSTGSRGARLPITYSLSSLSGTVYYVAPGGSDSAAGSGSAPLATVAAAVAKVGSGKSATVVVRGGTYRQGNLSIPSGRKIRIVAYPGEVPVFNGARALSASKWVTEGSLSYQAYTPQPVTNGSGISFTSGQNLTGDKVGKHPDQAWVGTTRLRQVTAKSAVTPGRFWVDATNKRIYLSATDVAKGGVEASDRDMFAKISGAGTSLEGLRIIRFSPSADDYGAIRVNGTAHGTTMRHVEITDTSFQAVQYAGSPLRGATMDNVTITHSNWMGVGSSIVDDLTLRRVKITDMNFFGEFTTSPQSGALKTSRNRRVKVLDSLIANNNSHGLWFDQSNVDVDVAGNTLTGNKGSSVFFEISDDLLMVNNYVRTTGGARALKIAGASGVKLVNNTIVGGADPIGVYVDNRSKPGCADPSKPLCANSYGSDRDTVRPLPATLDWMPRIDLMLNNIFAHPTATGYCGTTTALCITAANGDARAPIETVIHKADSTRGIPQTRIDGNVYTNSTSTVIATAVGKYASHSAFSTAMATTPVTITGLDTNSKTGTTWTNTDGTPTTALATRHNEAIAIPTDTNLNQYLPAGTRHYGALTPTS